MRTIKELLTITRDNLETLDLLDSGLCLLIRQMETRQIITTEELYLLLSHIARNRPSKRSKHYSKEMQYLAWYWPRGEVKPRKEWLDSIIEKL